MHHERVAGERGGFVFPPLLTFLTSPLTEEEERRQRERERDSSCT